MMELEKNIDKLKSNTELKEDKATENKIESPIQTVKENKFEVCAINYIKDNKVSIKFKEYNIFVELGANVEINPNDKTLKIYYDGEIGQPNFHYWIEE